MASLEAFVDKYIRLTDDLHEIGSYLSNIRLCLLIMTVSCYVGIIFYAVVLCLRNRQDNDHDGPPHQPAVVKNRRKSGASGANRPSGNMYDTEAGGNEWDDMMPPVENAVKTVDGYRYRSPAGARKTRLLGQQESCDFKSPKQQIVFEDQSPVITGKEYRRMSSAHAYRDGFIEKSPSIA